MITQEFIDRYRLTEPVDTYLIYVKNLPNSGFYQNKHIFKYVDCYIENNSIKVENIVNKERFTSGAINFVPLSAIFASFTNTQIKEIIHRDHIIKYAEIIEQDKIKIAEISSIEEKIGNNTMKNMKVNKIMNNNSDAAKTAAAISAGTSINRVVMAKTRGALPMAIRGYADHPLAAVVLANIVSFGVDNFASENDRARWIANAMLTAAMTEFFNTFDLEGVLNEVLEAASVVVPEEVV